MADQEVLLTREGLEKLENELNELKTGRRREVAARIKQALEFGDLSENSEYDDAKNEQAFVEGRIASLENMLRNARVIDEDSIDHTVAGIGAKVTLKDEDQGDEFSFTLVASAESDPDDSKISNDSPVGQAVMGKRVGEQVDVQAPAGTIRYKVLEISR